MKPTEQRIVNLARTLFLIKNRSPITPAILAVKLDVSERTARSYVTELRRRHHRLIYDLKSAGYIWTGNARKIAEYEKRLAKHARSEFAGTKIHRIAKRQGYNRSLSV